MKNKTLLLIFLLFIRFVFSQDGEIIETFTSYKNHPIVFTDIGFSTAPVNIKYPFTNQISKIQLRHNQKMMLGFGTSFRWFSIRVGAALIGNARPIKKFGKASYFDLGLQFSVKKIHAELDIRNYSGYVIKNAFLWNPTLNQNLPNDLNQDIGVYNIAWKMWYFNNKNFKLHPFKGNRGVYNKQVTTWYLTGKTDIYGIGNSKGYLISPQLHDVSNSKTRSTSFSAFEFGVIPGFGYVNRIGKIQFGCMSAVGPMMQFKSYRNPNLHSLAGIVARYDFKLIGGYNIDNFFAMLHLEIDNKSIHFNQLKYNQTFFYFKIQTGYRFKEKPKKNKK